MTSPASPDPGLDRLHDDLQAEYAKLVDIVTGYDQRLLTIKGWGVTLSLASLGFGFQQGHYGLFLVAAASGLAFWAVEATTKIHQIHYYPRLAHRWAKDPKRPEQGRPQRAAPLAEAARGSLDAAMGLLPRHVSACRRCRHWDDSFRPRPLRAVGAGLRATARSRLSRSVLVGPPVPG